MITSDAITTIKGIGEKSAAAFSKIGIFSVLDLLEHYPKGYEVFQEPRPLAQIREGQLVSIEASITSMSEVKRIKNLQILTCRVQDPTGSMQLSWFNQAYLKNTLKRGYHYIFRGRAVRKNEVLVLEQPKIYTREEYLKLMHTVMPIYSLTEGITNHAVSKAVKLALAGIDELEEYLPLRIRKEYQLLLRKQAVTGIHFPEAMQLVKEARKRLVFDEFFLFKLSIRELKEKQVNLNSTYHIGEREEINHLLANLPFELTAAQKKVWEELRSDLTRGMVMHRLIQGDVGSGKTILAVLALFLTALHGYQGCIMAPTEVLARQHYEEMTKLLTPFGIRIALITGSMTASQKRKVYERIQLHMDDLVVGTHALIQERVIYDKLALVITDEQHRFGVRQRELLASKGENPHVLVMSATPIPRTLAIILYGDLDISVVNELPADRLPIKNCVVNSNYRPTAYRFLEREAKQGRQAYVICPMVEESEVIEAENVTEYTEQLKEALEPGLVIEYLHGKMRPDQKNAIMERFSSGEINILVSTTVVEVGVNVPNATVMLIENAERFGLAQLHQLRGRVGRGKFQSYCILISGTEDESSMERLEILNKSNDGFFIAEEDLKLRGPGDMFGVRQSGELEFKLADIFQDSDVLKAADQAEKSLTQKERSEIAARYPKMKERVNAVVSGSL